MVDREPLLLGLDIGSTRMKALLVNAGGDEVGASALATPFETTTAGSQAAVAALDAALRELLARLAPHLERVAAVGIAGLAESGAPLDRAGRALGPIIAWHDPRGDAVADRVRAAHGPDLAQRIGQQLRPVSTVAKLGWLLDNGVTQLWRWLGVPELCLAALTGAHATECSLAARTGCRDIARHCWLPEVAHSAGFAVEVFPDVMAAGRPMGFVSRSAAAWSGLSAGAPVTLAGHDHLVGAIGAGTTVDDLANSVGTAETVVARASALPDTATAVARGTAVTVYPGGEEWAILASAARSGIALRIAATRLGRSFEDLDRLAVEAPLLDAPGLEASLLRREPPVLPDGPAGAVWRTLLEALAALTADAVGRVTTRRDPASRLVVFGGGARSDPWVEAKARRVGLPVWRGTRGEMAARGAAVLAGQAAGWWPCPTAGPAAGLVAVMARPSRGRPA